MAVGADWCERVAAGDGLAMRALQELLLDVAVALTAGCGNIELEDGGFLVTGAANFMDTMAVGADRCFRGACGHSPSVNAFGIRSGGLRAISGTCHDQLLSVACGTGGGYVGVTHG